MNMKQQARRDHVKRDQYEIMLIISEYPEMVEAIARRGDFAYTWPEAKYPGKAVLAVKTALVNYIGVAACPKTGEPLRCPNNRDSFISIDHDTLIEFNCSTCDKVHGSEAVI